MQKVLEQLVALQELDTRLDELISKLGDLPETVKTLEIQIDNEKEQNEVRKRSIEENAELARGKNIIVEEENAKIGRYKDQLYLVTTNKEYDALNSQIEFSENEVRDAKSIIEQAGEEQERLKEALVEADKNISDMIKKLEESKVSLEKTEEEIESEKSKLEKDRKILAAEIPRNYMSTYRRVRRARSGLAVVPMLRDACGGCHNRLIPQKRVDIYKRNKVITCDFCGRFLYAVPSELEEK